jgi:chromosome segregation ATPase
MDLAFEIVRQAQGTQVSPEKPRRMKSRAPSPEMDSTKVNISTSSSDSGELVQGTREIVKSIDQEKMETKKALAEQLESLKHTITEQHDRETERLRKVALNLNEKVTKLENENRSLSLKLDFAESRVERLESEKDDKESSIKSAHEKELQHQIQLLTDKYDKLQSRHNGLTDKLRSAESRVESRNSKELRTTKKQYQEETQRLVDESDRRLNDLDAEWADRFNAMERELTETNKRFKSLTQKAESRSDETRFRDLQQRYDSVKTALEKTRRENQQLRKQGTSENDKERELAYLRYNFENLLKINKEHVDKLNRLEKTSARRSTSEPR